MVADQQQSPVDRLAAGSGIILEKSRNVAFFHEFDRNTV